MAINEEPRGPTFTATFAGINITTAVDLFEIVAPANSRILLREFAFGQYDKAGDVNADMLDLRILRGHTSGGSGGSAVTPVNTRFWASGSQSPTSGALVEACNTTLASGGSPQLLRAHTCNAQAGYHWYPLFRADRIVLDFGQRLVFRLNDTPNPAITANATLVWQELGSADV